MDALLLRPLVAKMFLGRLRVETSKIGGVLVTMLTIGVVTTEDVMTVTEIGPQGPMAMQVGRVKGRTDVERRLATNGLFKATGQDSLYDLS